MYTYKFMKSVRVIPVSAVLSRVPYGYVFLHMGRIPRLHTRASGRRAFEPSAFALIATQRAMQLLLALATIVLLPQCACGHTGMGDVLDAAAPLTRGQEHSQVRR